MRRLLLVAPLAIAAAGLAYLIMTAGSGAASGAKVGPDGMRKRTPKEMREFHYVPELGEKARPVNGSPYLYEVRFLGKSYTTHFHGKDTKLLPISSDIKAPKDARSAVGKALSAGYSVSGDPNELIRQPPNDVGNWDWTGRNGRGYYRNNNTQVSGSGYACTQSGPRLEFVYLHPSTWNRLPEVRRGVEEMVKAHASLISQRSWELGGPPVAKVKVECSGGTPTVYEVEVPNPAANARCTSTTTTGTTTTTTTTPGGGGAGDTCYWTREELKMSTTELRDLLISKGYTGEGSRYIMLWDGTLNEDNRASAFVPTDDGGAGGADETTYGAAALGPYYGNEPWGPYIHEVTHTMGAFSPNAPHENNGGHCTDGAELMCYSESGDLPQDEKCEEQLPVLIDCHGDDRGGDYFNPLPKPGTFLTTHYNTGDKENGFFEYSGTDRCKWVNVQSRTYKFKILGHEFEIVIRSGGELSCEGTSVGNTTNILFDEKRDETVAPNDPKQDPKIENVPVG